MVDCGSHSCGSGTKCGSRGTCIASDAVDCGNGKSCPAGYLCRRSGGCASHEQLAEERAERLRQRQEELAQRKAQMEADRERKIEAKRLAAEQKAEKAKEDAAKRAEARRAAIREASDKKWLQIMNDPNESTALRKLAATILGKQLPGLQSGIPIQLSQSDRDAASAPLLKALSVARHQITLPTPSKGSSSTDQLLAKLNSVINHSKQAPAMVKVTEAAFGKVSTAIVQSQSLQEYQSTGNDSAPISGQKSTQKLNATTKPYVGGGCRTAAEQIYDYLYKNEPMTGICDQTQQRVAPYTIINTPPLATTSLTARASNNNSSPTIQLNAALKNSITSLEPPNLRPNNVQAEPTQMPQNGACSTFNTNDATLTKNGCEKFPVAPSVQAAPQQQNLLSAALAMNNKFLESPIGQIGTDCLAAAGGEYAPGIVAGLGNAVDVTSDVQSFVKGDKFGAVQSAGKLIFVAGSTHLGSSFGVIGRAAAGCVAASSFDVGQYYIAPVVAPSIGAALFKAFPQAFTP